MNIVENPKSYIPKFNIDTGVYDDVIPPNSNLFKNIYPNGLMCCNGKTFLERTPFRNHTKTNVHVNWLLGMKEEENNPIKKVIECEKTIKSQQIIIQHQSNELFRLKLKQNDIESKTEKNNGIFYIIKDRESVRMNERVFKVGITTRTFNKRFKEYGRDSRAYLVYNIENPVIIENKIKDIFSKEFKLVRGTEYFEGPLYKMIEIATKVLCN